MRNSRLSNNVFFTVMAHVRFWFIESASPDDMPTHALSLPQIPSRVCAVKLVAQFLDDWMGTHGRQPMDMDG